MDNFSIVYQHTGEPERPGRYLTYHYNHHHPISLDLTLKV